MIGALEFSRAGFSFLGRSYEEMDCQAFVERCMKACGMNRDLGGSNSWYRECLKTGWAGTPEECKQRFGLIPKGALLFILEPVGPKTPAKFREDGIGDATHMGIKTGTGQGAIHSSHSRGGVCESKFADRTIRNGGWNRVGLLPWFDYGAQVNSRMKQNAKTETGGNETLNLKPTLKRGNKNDLVKGLQEKLQSLGYSLGICGVDGDFGLATEAAVKAFQRDHGLEADGIVGKNTYAMLEEVLTEPVWLEDGGRYSVIISGLDLTQAQRLQQNYPGSVIEKEMG